jgi:hypothetical protein
LPITPVNLSPVAPTKKSPKAKRTTIDKYGMNIDQGHKKGRGCRGDKTFSCTKSGEVIKDIKGKKFESMTELHEVISRMNTGFGVEIYYVHIDQEKKLSIECRL